MLASKILIVEDEGIIAMDIRNQLEGFGYEVVGTAFSGGQAITLATEHLPDLVIMDIVLKGQMDGISAAQCISDSLHIPVIFLTAYSDMATLTRAKATGAYGYLVKPFRPDELHASIEVALYKHQLESKLKESEQWFAKTLHCISDAVVATDVEGKIEFMNPVAEEVTGWRLTDAKGATVSKVITFLDEAKRLNIDNPILEALDRQAVSSPSLATLLVSKSGAERPIDDGAAPIIDDNGKLLGAVLVFRDISARRKIENLLRESEERFHSAFDQAAIGMALVAIDGRFLQVNNSLCAIFGYTRQELLSASLKTLTHQKDHDRVLEYHLHQLLSDELPAFQVEVECFHKIIGKMVWTLLSASLVRDISGNPQYFIFQIQDITDRKYAEQQLVYVANHDPLTGLLNRLQFHNRLTQTLAAAHRFNTKLAVMFLDLDRFKLINDTLGHRLGDLLLQQVSERLKASVRSNDLLARLGGDEFIVLLSHIELIDDVARIAQKVIDTLSEPFTVEGHDIVITASVGISVYPDDGDDSQNLLMNADSAMYLAKDHGKNNYQFYTAEMTARSLERMTIERGLRHALKNFQLRVHYQPQINAASGRLVSVEALVRWEHPEWGLVYPDRFIGIAEETGLIVPIGLWVLRTACLQAKAWQDNDGPCGAVAVNLSPRQFLEQNIFQSIKNVLDDTGLKPNLLELEITESAVMQNPVRTLGILRQLQALGVRISIDDFGTGYSSLTYLRQFPVQSVKIDKSFVQDIPSDEGSMTLVRAIIGLAHELKMDVITEGIETEAQLDFLKFYKSDLLQGYIYSRPVTAKQLESDFDSAVFKTFPQAQFQS